MWYDSLRSSSAIPGMSKHSIGEVGVLRPRIPALIILHGGFSCHAVRNDITAVVTQRHTIAVSGQAA